MTPSEFRDKVNGNYKMGLIGNDALGMHRFSSGIVTLDLALGGGWPYNRINLIVGSFSSGKTFTANKAIQSIQNVCKTCRRSFTLCKCGAARTTSTVLYVDTEVAYDLEWAKICGVNVDPTIFSYCRPQYGEQAVDIITAAIESKTFDLIVIDSMATIIPSKIISDSAEDQQIAIQARLLNKACQKWLTSTAKLSDKEGPCILALTQFRYKAGLTFGDPRTIPGGEGQKYVSSVIAYTDSPKVNDSNVTGASATSTLGGYLKKNKTYKPELVYSFDLFLHDSGPYKKGDVNNATVLFDLCKKHEILVKKDAKWTCIGQPPAFPDIVLGRTEEESVNILIQIGKIPNLWRKLTSKLLRVYYV